MNIKQLATMATTNALASEFIEDMPKSVAMTDEQMQALHKELEPVLERVTEELKAVVNKHGAALVGRPQKTGPNSSVK